MSDPVIIDGSIGEGGGQVIRTSLSLSMITGRPVRLKNIRIKRKNPGLRSQHLCALRSSQEVCGAEVEGAEFGSRSFMFTPGAVQAGEYRFDIGTAGSTALVLQTVLPALMLADVPSRVTVLGGTHNSQSPPFRFMERTFLPLLGRMGPMVAVELGAHGFYPKGGGRITATIAPCAKLKPLELLDGGPVLATRATAIVSNLPVQIARRELTVVHKRMGWAEDTLTAEAVNSPGPGNAVGLEIEREHITEVFTGFGRRGRPAEAVAALACDEAREYLACGAPVGRRLADQLLLPMALSGGGRFATRGDLDAHTTTNMAVISMFLPVEFGVELKGDHTIVSVSEGPWS